MDLVIKYLEAHIESILMDLELIKNDTKTRYAIQKRKELEPMLEQFTSAVDKLSSGNSLPLKIERIIAVVAQRWGKDYGGSTVGIIGRDAIEICEQYVIDWENYR